jgi:hypothetical protein
MGNKTSNSFQTATTKADGTWMTTNREGENNVRDQMPMAAPMAGAASSETFARNEDDLSVEKKKKLESSSQTRTANRDELSSNTFKSANEGLRNRIQSNNGALAAANGYGQTLILIAPRFLNSAQFASKVRCRSSSTTPSKAAMRQNPSSKTWADSSRPIAFDGVGERPHRDFGLSHSR